jgi:hypothetical protein
VKPFSLRAEVAAAWRARNVLMNCGTRFGFIRALRLGHAVGMRGRSPP